eukprot:m.148948 g.148948  ORF g.148948 m.148948 type:complete len:352 (+) comp15063_c6_seq1:7457-8512(+)
MLPITWRTGVCSSRSKTAAITTTTTTTNTTTTTTITTTMKTTASLSSPQALITTTTLTTTTTTSTQPSTPALAPASTENSLATPVIVAIVCASLGGLIFLLLALIAARHWRRQRVLNSLVTQRGHMWQLAPAAGSSSSSMNPFMAHSAGGPASNTNTLTSNYSDFSGDGFYSLAAITETDQRDQGAPTTSLSPGEAYEVPLTQDQRDQGRAPAANLSPGEAYEVPLPLHVANTALDDYVSPVSDPNYYSRPGASMGWGEGEGTHTQASQDTSTSEYAQPNYVSAEVENEGDYQQPTFLSHTPFAPGPASANTNLPSYEVPLVATYESPVAYVSPQFGEEEHGPPRNDDTRA